MASYVMPNDLRVHLVRDPEAVEGTAAEMSDVTLQNAIDMAQPYVDGSLTNRFSVPFPAPVPALVLQLTLAFAAYHADLIHRESIDLSDNDPMQRLYVWADKTLTRLANGELDLPDLTDQTQVKPAGQAFNLYSGTLFWPQYFGLDETG